jgi:hypothetical protein
MATGAGIRYLAIALRRRRAKVMVSHVFVAQRAATSPCRADAIRSLTGGVASFRRFGQGPVGVAAASAGSPGGQLRGSRGPCTANGAPLPGAPSHGHVRPGYQACTLTAVVGRRWSTPLQPWRSCGHYSPATARLPRLVARGYPASVYGPSARDSFVLGLWRLWKACGVMDSLSQSIELVACPQHTQAAAGGRGPSSENAAVAGLSPVMRCCARLPEDA